ncbi:MAG: hypothetical protein QM661_06995 [Solimonas sp.]
MRRALRRRIARLAGSAAAVATDAAWTLEKEADGIRIESRAVPGRSVHEIRGTARVPAPLPAVVAVLDDVSAIPQLNDMVAEARIVRRDSTTHYRLYAAMKMPAGRQSRHRLLSDPGGIPAALINRLSVSTPFRTIGKLRELAAQPKYARARPDFLGDFPGAASPP